jgi:hypothetical protein
MATTITAFPKGQTSLASGDVDPAGDTLKILLLQNSYTYDATDQYVTDLTPATHEHDAGGYARKTLANVTVGDRADGLGAKIDADDVTWTALAVGTLDLRYAVVYQHVTDDTDSRLLWILDFGQDLTPDGADFRIEWSSAGMIETENRVGADAVTTVDQNSPSGAKILYVAATTNFAIGDVVLVDKKNANSKREFLEVESIQDAVSLTMTTNLTYTHTAAQADDVTGWH